MLQRLERCEAVNKLHRGASLLCLIFSAAVILIPDLRTQRLR
jgi:hypothetical protein